MEVPSETIASSGRRGSARIVAFRSQSCFSEKGITSLETHLGSTYSQDLSQDLTYGSREER